MQHQCPLCGSALSARRYQSVLKVQAKTVGAQRRELERLKMQATVARTAAKRAVTTARREAVDAERRKGAIRDKRLIARIKKLEEEKRMLRKHTSPQEMGLADEVLLVRKLRVEFPDDVIEHTGISGDVLQHVYLGKESVGCIVYECKRTDRIALAHVRQTVLAKKMRNAYFAILVTTGTRRGFSGLDQDSSVFLVSPSGVLTLARLCRESVIVMAKQRFDTLAKVEAAKRLMDFVTGPLCRTPLEDALAQAQRDALALRREMKQHLNDWRARNEVYQTIHCDLQFIQGNLARILSNQPPLNLVKPQLQPLPRLLADS